MGIFGPVQELIKSQRFESCKYNVYGFSSLISVTQLSCLALVMFMRFWVVLWVAELLYVMLDYFMGC